MKYLIHVDSLKERVRRRLVARSAAYLTGCGVPGRTSVGAANLTGCGVPHWVRCKSDKVCRSSDGCGVNFLQHIICIGIYNISECKVTPSAASDIYHMLDLLSHCMVLCILSALLFISPTGEGGEGREGLRKLHAKEN
jgi:hypothetical protein